MPNETLTIDNGSLADFTIAVDVTPEGPAQIIKLAVSADGSSVLVPADEVNGVDVDVTRVKPGSGSTDLGKAEDAPHTSGDIGVAAWAVRKDASGPLAGDGDYHPLLLDSNGALKVAASGLTGGVQFNEDTAHTSGDAGTLALAVRNDAGTSMTNTDGDYGALQLDSRGWLRVTGLGDLYGPTEYTADDALPANGTGPLVMTRRTSVPAVTAPADGDAQGIRSSATGALWVAQDPVNHGYGSLTVKFKLVNLAAGATDTSLVAAVATKKIRVLQALIVAGDTGTDLTFNSKGVGAGVPITPLLNHAPNGGEVLPYSQVGWFETVAGEALTGTTSAGSATGILIAYVEV
jgi:hypothetical protein